MKRLLSYALVTALLSLSIVTVPASAHHRPNHCHGAPRIVLLGTAGPDVIVGTKCDEYIAGLGGNDVLVGRGGHDTLRGNAGRDSLRGADGVADILNGGPGRDRCRGDAIDTFISCEVKVVVP